jgi:hypothetical protein
VTGASMFFMDLKMKQGLLAHSKVELQSRFE